MLFFPFWFINFTANFPRFIITRAPARHYIYINKQNHRNLKRQKTQIVLYSKKGLPTTAPYDIMFAIF